MDGQETRLIVFARIPDVSAAGFWDGWTARLKSQGRILDQATSFRMLATVALLLVGVAILPSQSNKNERPTDTPSVAEAAPPSVAPASTASAPAKPASPPVAASNPAHVLPATVAANRSAVDQSATDASAMSSPWPNKAHPPRQLTASGEEPQTGVDETLATRPPEYYRNRYDGTRPSVH